MNIFFSIQGSKYYKGLWKIQVRFFRSLYWLCTLFCDVEAHTHVVKEGLFETGILVWGYFTLQSWFSLQFSRSWGKICNRAHTKLKGKKKMFSVPSRQKVSPVGNQVDTNKHHFMPNIKCILYANNMTGGTQGYIYFQGTYDFSPTLFSEGSNSSLAIERLAFFKK